MNWINKVIDFEMNLKGSLIIFSIVTRITPNTLPIFLIIESITLMITCWLSRIGSINLRSIIVTGIPFALITENINLMNLNIRRARFCPLKFFIVGIKSFVS